VVVTCNHVTNLHIIILFTKRALCINQSVYIVNDDVTNLVTNQSICISTVSLTNLIILYIK
jgi:hypothetical protein